MYIHIGLKDYMYKLGFQPMFYQSDFHWDYIWMNFNHPVFILHRVFKSDFYLQLALNCMYLPDK